MGKVEGHGVTRGLSPTICSMGLEVPIFFLAGQWHVLLIYFKIDARLLR